MLRFVVWLVCSYFDRINGISPVALNILQKKRKKEKIDILTLVWEGVIPRKALK